MGSTSRFASGGCPHAQMAHGFDCLPARHRSHGDGFLRKHFVKTRASGSPRALVSSGRVNRVALDNHAGMGVRAVSVVRDRVCSRYSAMAYRPSPARDRLGLRADGRACAHEGAIRLRSSCIVVFQESPGICYPMETFTRHPHDYPQILG